MSFLWASALWLLLLVPALVLLYVLMLRRRRKLAVRYGALRLVKDAMGAGAGFRRHIPPVLFLAALATMILAVARPAAVVTLPSQRGTVILAMDVSGSMRATDIPPTRLAASQAAAQAFIAKQPKNVRIGVVAFAGTSAVVQAPTLEREDALQAIDRFQAQRGTAVGAGILTALATIFEDLDIPISFAPPRRGVPWGQTQDIEPLDIEPVPPGTYTSSVIVLLTDGRTTTGPNPIQAAELAADLGVRIYTVGLGTKEGVILGFGGRSRRVTLDEGSLTAIAEKTGGEYFQAGSEDELIRIYESLSTQLVLETEKTEVTAFFTAAAALLVMVAAMFSIAWFGRLV
jgi:Ca-activated chloride channel family protein